MLNSGVRNHHATRDVCAYTARCLARLAASVSTMGLDQHIKKPTPSQKLLKALMHAQLKNQVLLLPLLLMGLACTPEANEVQQSQKIEATDETCKHENLLKIDSEALRQDLASRCIRRGEFKPSPSKTY